MDAAPFLRDPAARSRAGWLVLRLVLAGLIAAHGWYRFLGGGVVPFGDWLVGQGIPFGFAVAATVTVIEIVGTVPFAFGKLVAPLALVYSAIYLVGIAMVHAKAGWFVVGGGRNGAEFSVLLVACLLCVGLQHLRARTPSRH